MRLALSVAALLVFAFAGTARAADFFVDSTADAAGDCTTAGTVTCTLRQAMIAAKAIPGSTIHVPAGHYVLTSGKQLPAIDVDVTIVGSGAKDTIIDGTDATRIFQFKRGSLATVQDLTVTHGSTNATGGAIFNDATLVNLDHVAVTHSEAGGSGGGIGGSGDLVIVDSEISNNTADTANGGGVWGRNVTINDSTVSGNSTGAVGGGIAVRRDIGALNDTIAGNQIAGETAEEAPADSVTAGAGIGSPSGVDFASNVQNTILASNLDNGQSDNCSVPLGSGDYNISDDASCGFAGTHDLNGVDPKLGPLGDDGGQTQTRAIGTDSPAFDGAADNGCPDHDQRDTSRLQGSACDVGAFELEVTAPNPPAPDPDPDPDPAAPSSSVEVLPSVAPAPQACVDTRKFTFRLHKWHKARVIHVEVFINGVRRAQRGHDITSISIAKLPQGEFTVKIVSRQSTGSTLTSVRQYSGCSKGRPRTTAHHAHRHHGR